MTSTVKSVLFVLLFFVCADAFAQLKKTASSDDLYKEAKKEIENKNYAKAVRLLNQAVDISPRNLDIHLLLGKAFGFAGKLDSARIELNYVIQKNPKYKDAYIYLVNIESTACNYLQALEYADMGLKYYPNDRDLLLKKLDIYSKEGDWIESTKLADYLFERYSTDSYIRSVYLDYKLTLARQYSHRGYIEIARRAYEAVLEQDPLNKEALQAVFSLDVKSENYGSSLIYVNRALQSSPTSYEFLMKKVGILESMSRYVEAIAVAQKLLKLYPGKPEVQKLNSYLRMEAGRFYLQEDPYHQFTSVLEREPANREALGYAINIAISRGMFAEGLLWANNGLKKYPNDKELLNKKMSLLEDMKRYDQASAIAEKIYRNSPTPAHKQTFLELRTLAAKQYINDQDYDSAVIALNSVLFYDHSNMAAINYKINALTQQKRYDEVLKTIDEALTYYNGNAALLFKKAGTLEAYEHYAEAAAVSRDLLNKYPDNKKYLTSFIQQSLQASKQSMQYDDFYATITILQEVLERDQYNPDALNYIINIEAANKQYDSALYYADIAVEHYPDNKDFKLKKSSVLADAGRFDEAVAISGVLNAEYPYNIRYRNAYVEQLAGYGKQLLASNKKDEALTQFTRALEVAPKDTLPLYYNINLLIDMQKNDEALELLLRGRSLYPTNSFFLLKKAQLYENQNKWHDAWLSADSLLKLTPYDPVVIDYTEMLYSKSLKNEFGFAYLHSKIIDTNGLSHVNGLATVQYSRRFRGGSLTARVNYAGRVNIQGFQYELEGDYTFAKTVGLSLLGAWSPDNEVFPAWRFGGALTFYLKKGWAAEIGGRYLLADGTLNDQNVPTGGTFYSGLLGVSHEGKDMYVGLRGYLTSFASDALGGQANTYYSALLTSRYYINNHADYFSTILGYGTIPDDFSRLYNLGGLITFPTVSVGAGFSHQFHYRTTLSLNGTWYNEKVGTTLNPFTFQSQGRYINQYDIFVTLLRRF